MSFVFNPLTGNFCLTGSGGSSSNSFTIMQPDHGTAPTASSGTDTLTFTSSDASVTITGNSSTKTLNFQSTGGAASFDPTTGSGALFDDFTAFTYPTGSQGPMHLTLSGTFAKDAPTSSETNRYGIVKFTSTTATSTGFFTDITPLYSGGGTFTAAMAFQLGSNIPTNAGNSWVSTWGIGDSFPTQLNGAFFSMNYLSPNFIAFTSNAGTTTQTDTGIAYAANTWYNFRVVLTPANAKFYINGTLVVTTTTNLPAANYGAVYYSATWQTGAGVNTRVDWVYSQWTPTSARGTF